MARTVEDIMNNKLTLADRGEMTTRQALIIAYNAIENDLPTPTPGRTQALAVIKSLLIQGDD